MIESVTLVTKEILKRCDFQLKNHKVVFDSDDFFTKNNSLDFIIVFKFPIKKFRNHDYQWVDCKTSRIANEFCPKIIQLDDGTMIQANTALGFWEISPKTPCVLYWRFNPEFSKPITQYQGKQNNKKIVQAVSPIKSKVSPELLITNGYAVEFSRSKIPFVPVVCFTDHCDFDTKENLKLQRELFHKTGIKITKGFFLNHFSKREDNASLQNDRDELMKWSDEGHELCYHSLSQSIKSDQESFEDFSSFQPPLDDITTWIDHGYQPYNFSLFKNSLISEKHYETVLHQKNIQVLWNYIDSGTATLGVINQCNPQHFTLKSFWNGTKNRSLVQRIQLMIKNIIFHFYNDELLILKYKSTATNFKKIFFQKKIRYITPLILNLIQISAKIFHVFLHWNENQKKPYTFAKYCPILFKHTLHEKEFYVFQTLEMIDFKQALSPRNIDLFIKEKGVFIAHTYFSVPMEYHEGRMFVNMNVIDNEVSKNFEFLGEKIKNRDIWNPTIQELVAYWSNFEKVILDVDYQGTIFVKNKTDLIYIRINIEK
ncbi:hypothetical protein [Flavobacterium aciduliphilum]|uniref:Uncharacterized protein n=1 Tax=Flavobacterium aciduliphilum TaxID=1101402 RepID=A0A328YHP4_9FLAO|nr:hypothetical protein [Flavobacterium aciduliphilum]RAR70227.1 hypothetical protein CLV55_11152 [Flavobacterium aciduliphilum]